MEDDILSEAIALFQGIESLTFVWATENVVSGRIKSNRAIRFDINKTFQTHISH